jgi:2-iminobutanoate/2-iminopropanoate deaminase
MDKKVIYSSGAPEPIGPYSQAISTGGLTFLSGQIGIDPKTGRLANDLKEQTKQVLENIGAILKSANKTFDDVIKTTCLLTDMADFAQFNTIYGQYIESKPACSTFAVQSLPLGALVEIEVIVK